MRGVCWGTSPAWRVGEAWVEGVRQSCGSKRSLHAAAVCAHAHNATHPPSLQAHVQASAGRLGWGWVTATRVVQHTWSRKGGVHRHHVAHPAVVKGQHNRRPGKWLVVEETTRAEERSLAGGWVCLHRCFTRNQFQCDNRPAAGYTHWKEKAIEPPATLDTRRRHRRCTTYLLPAGWPATLSHSSFPMPQRSGPSVPL